jgi:lysophospholipase L1-like esterase
MDYENIGSGTWGEESVKINSNFDKTNVEITKVNAATIKFKGYFSTLAVLEEKFNSPKIGDTAWAGTPYPGTIHDVLVDGNWHDTTVAPTVSEADLTEYSKLAGDQEFTGINKFSRGLELKKGFVAYGQDTLLTGVGPYVTGYVSPTYGARLLAYDGAAYQRLSLGPLVAGNFGLVLETDGSAKFAKLKAERGTATDEAMSQKAVTDELIQIESDLSELNFEIAGGTPVERQGTINITTKKWFSVNATAIHYLIPTVAGNPVVITAKSTHTTVIAYLSSNSAPVEDGDAPVIGEMTILAADATFTSTAPATTQYLLISKILNSVDRSPLSAKVNNEDVINLTSLKAKIIAETNRAIAAEESIGADAEEALSTAELADAKAADNTIKITNLETEVFGEAVSIEQRQGLINNVTNEWGSTLEADGTTHYLIPVVSGDSVTINTASGHTTPIAYLSSNVTPVNAIAAPIVGSVIVIAVSTTYQGTVPTLATYLMVMKTIGGIDRSPVSILLNNKDVFTTESLNDKIVAENARAIAAEESIDIRVTTLENEQTNSVSTISPNLFASNFNTMFKVLAPNWTVASDKKSINNSTNYGIENKFLIDREFATDIRYFIFDFTMNAAGIAYFGSYPSAFRLQPRAKSTVYLDLVLGQFGCLLQPETNDVPVDTIGEIDHFTAISNPENLIGVKLRCVIKKAVGISQNAKIINTVTGAEIASVTNIAGYLFERPVSFATVNITLYNIFVNTGVSPSNNCFMQILGDSITEGAGASVHTLAYSELISANFGSRMCVVSGRSSGVIQNVIERIASESTKLNPNYIIVTIGTNSGNTKELLRTMINSIIAIGAKPVVNHIPMLTSTPTTIAVNAMIDEVIAEYALNTVGCCKYDVATAINNTPASGQDTSLYISDLVHPNDAGHNAMYLRTKLDLPEIFSSLI